MLESQETFVGKYRIMFVSKNGEILGVVVNGSRIPRPLYISRNERIKAPKLPLSVKRFLRKKGFMVE